MKKPICHILFITCLILAIFYNSGRNFLNFGRNYGVVIHHHGEILQNPMNNILINISTLANIIIIINYIKYFKIFLCKFISLIRNFFCFIYIFIYVLYTFWVLVYVLGTF